MGKVFLVHEESGRKYEVTGLNKGEGTITLKGEHAEFTEKFDKDAFKKLGYQLKKE